MKKVPYEKNHGSSCALSCYTMAARYLWPEEDISFEEMARVADWRKGHVVWGFRVWKWMMDRGALISDFDVIDYGAWASEGVEGLQGSVSALDFDYYFSRTYDLEAETENIGLVFGHTNFSYVRRKITWRDVEREFGKPEICDVAVDAGVYDERREIGCLHRVILLDIADSEVIIHDPNSAGDGDYRRVPKELFVRAFEGMDGAELCRYSLGNRV